MVIPTDCHQSNLSILGPHVNLTPGFDEDLGHVLVATPVWSICISIKMLIWGEDQGEALPILDSLRLFEHVGEGLGQLIVLIIFTSSNGVTTASVISMS